MMTTSALLEARMAGRRLEPAEGLRLAEEAPLPLLARAAHACRQAAVDPNRVTYIVDRNINTTNVCVTGCLFCSFHRPPGHPEAYVLSREKLHQKVAELRAQGGTRILLQGGLHPDLGLTWHEEVLRGLRAAFPDVARTAFSPPEIDHMARIEGLSPSDVLRRLQQAGLDGLPGGGAEILEARPRRRASPRKLDGPRWIEIMDAAQRIGLVTTATMVIGGGETIEERLAHLVRLREQQDRARGAHGNGFVAYIGWTMQLGGNELGRILAAEGKGPLGAVPYLRHVALARLFLDNFDHIQASWPTQGPRTAQTALHFGADDFGGTMMEENVVAAAGARHPALTPEEAQRHIRGAGLHPAERDVHYRIRETVEAHR